MKFKRKTQNMVSFFNRKTKTTRCFCRSHPLGALLFSLAFCTNVFANGDRLLITSVTVGTLYISVQVTNFEERARLS